MNIYPEKMVGKKELENFAQIAWRKVSFSYFFFTSHIDQYIFCCLEEEVDSRVSQKCKCFPIIFVICLYLRCSLPPLIRCYSDAILTCQDTLVASTSTSDAILTCRDTLVPPHQMLFWHVNIYSVKWFSTSMVKLYRKSILSFLCVLWWGIPFPFQIDVTTWGHNIKVGRNIKVCRI